MKIGIIVGKNMNGRYKISHKEAYYYSGLSKCDEIEVMYFSRPLLASLRCQYNYFPINPKKVVIVEDNKIEQMKLDAVIYGHYAYIFEHRVPKSKSLRVTLSMRASIYDGGQPHFVECLKNSDVILKISKPKNMDIFIDENMRPARFKPCQLSDDIIKKMYPLMFVGSHALDYPHYPLNYKYDISFLGAVTSLDRIVVTNMLKEKFSECFFGGFNKDIRVQNTGDEDGNLLYGLEAPVNYTIFSRKNYLKLMRESRINLCPSGLGRNSYRLIDILCMGGMCLSCDISHIDYGSLGPVEGKHYISYSRYWSDLIDKCKYLLDNPKKCEEMRINARSFMLDTYCNNERMAREYILNVINK